MTAEQAKEIVLAKYPKALEVATGRQVWVQSPETTISKAYAWEKAGPNAAHLAWLDAAKLVLD